MSMKKRLDEQFIRPLQHHMLYLFFKGINKMLKIIPPLYPNEELYSWISRYHTYSGNMTVQEMKSDLFNINKREIEYSQLMKKVDSLCDNLQPNMNITPYYILNNHTKYPLYSAFDRVRGDKLNGQINTTCFNRIYGANFKLKICPKCYYEQMQQYGECFFVRYHQQWYVKHCYKHKIPLMTYYKSPKYGKLFDINCMNLNRDFICDYDMKFYNQYINLAYEYKDILDGGLSDLGLNRITQIYNNMLQAKGYKLGYNNNMRKLEQDFIYFYGENFLDVIDCNVKFNTKGDTWVYDIFSCNRISNIKHLLVIGFLFGNVSDLIKYNEEKIDNHSESFFINTIKTSNKSKSLLLQELHMSLNTAYKKSIRCGVKDIFMKKMSGYFDKECVNRRKKDLEQLVMNYPEKISRVTLAKLQKSNYEFVNSWDRDWVTKLIEKKNAGL